MFMLTLAGGVSDTGSYIGVGSTASCVLGSCPITAGAMSVDAHNHIVHCLFHSHCS